MAHQLQVSFNSKELILEPLSIFSVIFQLAAVTPEINKIFIKKENSDPTRTEIIEFYRNKLFFLPSLVMILFVGSTLLYSATGFEIVKYSATRSVIKKTSNIHYEYALQKINDPNIQYYQDYKFLYYYLNFQEYKEYLKKYKNLKYSDFVSAMSNDKLKN